MSFLSSLTPASNLIPFTSVVFQPLGNLSSVVPPPVGTNKQSYIQPIGNVGIPHLTINLGVSTLAGRP